MDAALGLHELICSISYFPVFLIYPWLERITKLIYYAWSNLGDLTRLGEALSNYYRIIV